MPLVLKNISVILHVGLRSMQTLMMYILVIGFKSFLRGFVWIYDCMPIYRTPQKNLFHHCCE